MACRHNTDRSAAHGVARSTGPISYPVVPLLRTRSLSVGCLQREARQAERFRASGELGETDEVASGTGATGEFSGAFQVTRPAGS